MRTVLAGLESFALEYLDDILIFSESIVEHDKHTETVFSRLREQGLKLRAKKCSFVLEKTQYLGFIIDKDGIIPDSSKVEGIRNLPSPNTVRNIRSFIGMYSYYRLFIQNFSKIA
jgi:hypothetical protein